MNHTRRHFLRTAAVLGAAGTTFMSYIGRQAFAQGVGGGNKKLLFIFLRGGNDGLNTLIPHGDTGTGTPGTGYDDVIASEPLHRSGRRASAGHPGDLPRPR